MPRQMAGDNTPPLSITLHINTLHFRVQILDNPLSLNTRTYRVFHNNRGENNGLLLQNEESWWLFETTGGFPGMVHLVKYASQLVCGAYEAFAVHPKRTPLKNGNIA